jgi:hypothetical protein
MNMREVQAEGLPKLRLRLRPTPTSSSWSISGGGWVELVTCSRTDIRRGTHAFQGLDQKPNGDFVEEILYR